MSLTFTLANGKQYQAKRFANAWEVIEILPTGRRKFFGYAHHSVPAAPEALMQAAKRADFKKGERVTLIGEWNGQGAVFYSHWIVVSCGKVQMVLENAEDGNLRGRHYTPVRAQGLELGAHPGMSDAEAEALCLQISAKLTQGSNTEARAVKAN